MTATHPSYPTRFNAVAIPRHDDVYFCGGLANNLQRVPVRSSAISRKAARGGSPLLAAGQRWSEEDCETSQAGRRMGAEGSQISGCEHLCCYWVYFNHKPEVTKAPLEDPGFTKPRFPAATGNSNGTLPRELTTLCLVVWRQLDAAFPLGKQRSRLRRGERSSSSALRESTHVHRLLRHVNLCQGCPETPHGFADAATTSSAGLAGSGEARVRLTQEDSFLFITSRAHEHPDKHFLCFSLDCVTQVSSKCRQSPLPPHPCPAACPLPPLELANSPVP